MSFLTIKLPYGRTFQSLTLDESRLKGILSAPLAQEQAATDQRAIIREALCHPMGTPSLREMSTGKKRITILSSDHTRPVPSRLILPELLKEIRLGNPEAEITILVATGCHRGTTEQELVEKYGTEITEQENIVIHNCDDDANMCDLGTLPSGGRCCINRIACEADLLISEGFIEPHFFAGFSGGRKSVLPGVASRQTVLANHCSEFIRHPRSRTGSLDGNLIHQDMLWAARQAGLSFILNVVLNHNREIIYAAAGEPECAHHMGCHFLECRCSLDPVEADIIIATNGGYPLDQNIYQAVKGMTAAEACIQQNSVIIMLAASCDGHGGQAFYREMSSGTDLRRIMDTICSRQREETRPDQWQVQIMLRVLLKAPVIFVSDAPDQLVKDLHMIPAHSVSEALEKADRMRGNKTGSIAIIPDGVSVIIRSTPDIP